MKDLRERMDLNVNIETTGGMEKFTEVLQYKIQKEFLEEGELKPKAYILTQIDPKTSKPSPNDDWHVVVVPAGTFNEAGKELFSRHVKESCKKYSAKAVMFTSEAWTSMGSTPFLGVLSAIWMRLGHSMEEFPGRQEIVMLHREVRGEGPALWHATISRIQEKKILGDFKKADLKGLSGRMAGFLE